MAVTMELTGTETLICIGLAFFPFVVLLVYLVLRDPHGRQQRRARRTFVDNIRPNESVLLVGTVRCEGEPLTAPFTGRPCIAYQAAIENDVDPTDPDSVLGGVLRKRNPDSMLLEDESGTARIHLGPSPTIFYVRAKSQVLRGIPMSTVDRVLEEWGATHDDMASGFPWGVTYTELPADLRAVEWLLAEGDRVVVMGQAGLEPAADGRGASGYRDAPLRAVIGPEERVSVQILVDDREVGRLAKRRRRIKEQAS